MLIKGASWTVNCKSSKCALFPFQMRKKSSTLQHISYQKSNRCLPPTLTIPYIWNVGENCICLYGQNSPQTLLTLLNSRDSPTRCSPTPFNNYCRKRGAPPLWRIHLQDVRECCCRNR
ncbi:hypothetical protein CDAR_429801 [Caerostris darwini]|uniref:Uncharacterized protein n=1 Tax=Caerostris darwini TaxID=1538125 RepID=A0AAV4VUF7_9ARAC|nr:hypothetical protein CDAR_429801 [Caerostris darwini]